MDEHDTSVLLVNKISARILGHNFNLDLSLSLLFFFFFFFCFQSELFFINKNQATFLVLNL